MAKFCKLLSDKGRVNWWRLCKEFDVNPELPQKEERRIHLEGKLESLEEIDRLMRKPGRGAWHE
jgi:hypothetical protein